MIRNHVIPISALIAVVVFITLPALDYGYLLEDYMYLRSYSPGEILRGFYSHWEPSQVESKGYRPFHAVHYALFHRLIGGDPVANHILKTALMVVLALMIYLLVWQCTKDLSAAFWSALIYNCLGANAWQASWLNHRHHILQGILLLASLIFYVRYLDRKSMFSWFLAFFFFLLTFLFKEEVATFPLALAAYAILVRKEKIRSSLRALLPFFLLAVFLVLMRGIVVKSMPAENEFPPPVSTAPPDLANEYGRSIFATLVQTYGVRDPENWDFPMYGSGLNYPRDYLGFFSLLGFFLFGGGLFFREGSRRGKNTAAFGVSLLLFISIIVSAWYRNNRLYLSSIGVALIIGPIAASTFRSLARRGERLLHAAGSVLALVCFFAYLAANLASFFEIQRALRPDETLSRVWDRWVFEEYLPWMQPEQLEIFREKLLISDREEWAARVGIYTHLIQKNDQSPDRVDSRTNNLKIKP